MTLTEAQVKDAIIAILTGERLHASVILALQDLALAQIRGQGQEPVAWWFQPENQSIAPKFDTVKHGGAWKPLYTAPQPAPQEIDDLLSKLSSASVVLSGLPEIPDYNGSVLMIDDVEVARIVKDIDSVVASISQFVAAGTDAKRYRLLRNVAPQPAQGNPIGWLEWPSLTFRFNGTVERIGALSVNAEPIPLYAALKERTE